MSDQVGVIGAGAWGTTLAVQLADAQRPVTLWTHATESAERLAHGRENARYLPGVTFPPNLRVATEDAHLAEPYRVYLAAVPSSHLRDTLRRLAPALHPGVPVLSLVKGIEEHTHARMSQVIAEELPGRAVAVLSGPNLAREIAAGKPAGSVIASDDAELAGALKNIVALAAGMVDGLGFGDSAKAGIITRGLAEMTRLGVAAGAHPGTFAGLAGVGDLIATCMSPLSRNRRAGELIASGLSWQEARVQLAGVAEGVFTVAGALELAAQHDTELPIAEQVRAVVHEGRSPLEAVASLMSRERKDELSG